MRGCRRMMDLLDDFVHEALSPRAQAAVQAHLARCPQCAVEFRAARALLARLPSDTARAVPAGARARILSTVSERRRAASERPFPLGRFVRGTAFAVAGAAATAALVFLVLPRTTQPGTTPNAPWTSSGPPRPGRPNAPVIADGPAAPAQNPPAPIAANPPVTEDRMVPSAIPPGTRGSRAPRDREIVAPNPEDPDESHPAPPSDEDALVAPTPVGLDDATVVPISEVGSE